VMITRAITFLIMGLTFIFITRFLGPSLFGVYTIAIATAGFFGAFGDLGVSTMFMKFIPRYLEKKQTEKIKSLLVNGYTIIILESLFFTVVALLLSGFVAQNVLHNPSDTLALELVSFSIILSILYSSSYSALIAFGNGDKLIKAVTIYTLIQSFLSAGLVLYGFGPIGPIIGLDAAYLFGMIYAVRVIIKRTKVSTATPMRGWRRIISFSVPLGLTNMLSTITSNFSLIALQLLSTTIIVGNFGAAYKAIGIFDVLLGSVGITLLPFFSVALSDKNIYKQINRYYNYSMYFVFIFAAPVVFYVVVLSQQFSYTIFSGIYALTPLYLALMSIGALIMAVYTYTYNLLVGAGEVRKVFKYNLAASVLQLALLYFFIKPFAGLGLTVLMFLVTPTVLSALYINRVKHLFHAKLDLLRLGKVVLAAIISALFLVPLTFVLSNNILLLIVGAAEQVLLYPIIISLIGAIDRDRLDIINKVTESIPVFGSVARTLVAYAGVFMRE
jgi:O-antigen/teichoic acid export membrane protein